MPEWVYINTYKYKRLIFKPLPTKSVESIYALFLNISPKESTLTIIFFLIKQSLFCSQEIQILYFPYSFFFPFSSIWRSWLKYVLKFMMPSCGYMNTFFMIKWFFKSFLFSCDEQQYKNKFLNILKSKDLIFWRVQKKSMYSRIFFK